MYNQQVNDFYHLDKAKIWAINFSATQELDRIVKSLTERIKVLEAKI